MPEESKPLKKKIIFNKEACIGAFNCIYQDPRNWKQAPNDNRKVDLHEALQNEETKFFEKIVDADKVDPKVEASCPVAAIKIVDHKEEE